MNAKKVKSSPAPGKAMDQLLLSALWHMELVLKLSFGLPVKQIIMLNMK